MSLRLMIFPAPTGVTDCETLCLDEPGEFEVKIEGSSGSAQLLDDSNNPTSSLKFTFAKGDTDRSKQLKLVVADDTQIESNETVRLSLMNLGKTITFVTSTQQDQ